MKEGHKSQLRVQEKENTCTCRESRVNSQWGKFDSPHVQVVQRRKEHIITSHAKNEKKSKKTNQSYLDRHCYGRSRAKTTRKYRSYSTQPTDRSIHNFGATSSFAELSQFPRLQLEYSDNSRCDRCDLRRVFGECSEESPRSFSLLKIKDGGICGRDKFWWTVHKMWTNGARCE